TANSDYLQNTTIGFNFRLGKGQESYWFQNPLTTIYNDVRDLKRFNKTDDKDGDNDGVVDSRDKEPNSPEGVLVDGQGRAVDSDGDGIQDFRDKEPFSPKGAEVDRSGIAMDSDNDGVIDFYDEEPGSSAGGQSDANGKAIAVQAKAEENVGGSYFGMVNFDLNSSEIEQEYYPVIFQVAKYLNENPGKTVVVIGNADNRGNSEANTELSKARATNVAKVLNTNLGIATERIKIDYKGADEQLVKNLPADYKDPKLEALQFLNRRVEFRVIE
ncbi:MAG TPA: OmpA family protein, partial [Bacteroidia bacterium]|nr:OmpA family protein [Bacteroidia bacterium]